MFMKQALSIGIKNYFPGHLFLEPCIHDAKDVADALRSIGFHSKFVGDVDLNPMKSAIYQFINSIQPGAVVVFYFSGHGVESDSNNYLIPRNVLGLSAANIRSTAIDAQEVIKAMHKRKPRVVICILDCCRDPAPDEPVDEHSRFKKVLAGTRPGLAPMRSPEPTIIVYACAAHESASPQSKNNRNSLYTYYLLRYIRTPNVDIETLLKYVSADCQRETDNEQIPYRYSSCNELICLAGYKALASPRYMQPRPIVRKFLSLNK
jgi:uncharacterized caspase-like protein